MNPLSQETTNDYYRTNQKHDTTSVNMDSAHAKRSQKQARFILDAIGSIETVLEIGALAGGNLNIYKEMGLTVCGTDLSINNVEYAKRQYDIELYQMDFDTFYVENNDCFDLVILSNILEHIIDPYSMMKKVAEFNTNYVYIEVPGFDYKYIDMPYGMFIPTHQSYFTLESLKNLMKCVGYELLDANLLLADGEQHQSFNTPLMQSVWQRSERYEVKRKPSCLKTTISSEQHLDFYLNSSKLLIENIAGVIDRIPDDLRLAVWCLSRHTALLFQHTTLSKKHIVKFYETDDIFHGRIIRGRKVGYFSKADVEQNNIEAILISSYEHQNRIVSQIIESGVNCEIITFYE